MAEHPERHVQITMSEAEAHLLIELLRQGRVAASPPALEAGQHLLAALEAALASEAQPMAQ